MCLHRKMNQSRTFVVPTFAILLLAAIPLAAEDDCKPVFDAFDKVMTVPVHIYSTISTGGKPTTTESIYTSDGIFSNHSGKWTPIPVKREEVAKQEEESRKKSVNTCRYLKDEEVNGEMAAVYSSKTASPEQKADGKVWISKNAGVPLRHESDLVTGADGATKNHYSVRYEYKNVAPPKM